MALQLLHGAAMHARGVGDAGIEVAIVSTNPETLDGLQSYLTAAGVTARCTRSIEECARLSTQTIAFVLFPDDFRWQSVRSAIADLAAQRPHALPVLVTAQPKRFAELVEADRVLVVPRPVWGWKILDAIRAHYERGAGAACTGER